MPADPAPASPVRRVHWLVKAFVLFHMVLVVSWTVPNPPPAVANESIRPEGTNLIRYFPDFLLKWNIDYLKPSPTRYYLVSTGLWQYWDMFSPNPASTDIWVDVIVTYADGERRVVEYPRMVKLGIVEKQLMERYRKYLERLTPDAYAFKWPQFALRMAYLSDTEPGNPPVEVQLRRHWRILRGPDRPVPQGYSTYTFFTYVVPADELRRMHGK